MPERLREVMASRPVQVFINGRFLTQRTTGVQRYALELTRALNALLSTGEIRSTEYAFTLLAPRGATSVIDLEHIPLRHVGRFRGHMWEQFELPTHARGGVLLNPCNAAPVFGGSGVVTIHDAGVFVTPWAYSLAFGAWYRFLHLLLAQTATVIITVSEHSRAELQRVCRIPSRRITVIPNGGEHMAHITPDESVLDRHDLRGKPYVLAVSSLNPNKNFQAVLRAVEHLGMLSQSLKVVVAGGTNRTIFGASSLPITSGVKYIGYVSDHELKALYRGAVCFIYPSVYEGFGLPPVEAMSCGCPVIVSRASSLPEVCGDAALYCDPQDPRDLAEKISLVFRDVGLRACLQAKGLRRSAEFSWKQCARHTFSILETVARSEQ